MRTLAMLYRDDDFNFSFSNRSIGNDFIHKESLHFRRTHVIIATIYSRMMMPAFIGVGCTNTHFWVS